MISDAEAFEYLKLELKETVLSHPIIKRNRYLWWFSQTSDLTKEDLIILTKEFSVFSNQFIVAQLHKTLNANSLEQMHDAKEILVNELGVLFTNETVDNSTFRFKAAHFEWLVHFASKLDLEFNDIGKRKHGSPSTLFYCDELIRIYGSPDFNTAAGASFAVENWANAGFWQQLMDGIENFNEYNTEGITLPLNFFSFHDKLEAQHAQHTWDELRDLHDNEPEFDKDKFIAAGMEMLDGVNAFWEGLDQDRIVRYWRESRGT